MSTPGEILEALGREARSRMGNGRDTATRVYRGRSVEELVPQIQRDLGADAIILRRREGLTGGVLGFFQRAFVEIEAMPGGPGVDLYDEDAGEVPLDGSESYAGDTSGQISASEHQPEPQVQPATAAPQPAATPAPQPAAAPPPPLAPHLAPNLPQRPTFDYRTAAMRPTAPAPPAFAPPPQPASPATAASSSPTVAEPLPTPFYTRQATPAPAAAAGSAYVTAHLAALARAERAKSQPRGPVPERREGSSAWATDFQELIPREQTELFPRPAARAPSERRVVAPGSQARARAGVAKSLQRCGIGEELAHELIDAAGAHALALAPRAGLVQAVRATLAQRIPVAPPLATKGAAVVVVGAGGAGKTTFCTTLLGAYRRSSSLPASFATIIRAGERGELRMLLAPHIVKPTPADSPNALRALRRARSDGMAILDTPSLSPSDRGGARELARLLAEMAPERVVVALPATLGATAAAQLLQALAPLGANALAITHADETDQLGVAVEAACRFGLAPEYMLERGRGGAWRLRQLTPTVLAERLLP